MPDSPSADTTTQGPNLGFIVGHYKSGSTWLAHLLALHPDVRMLSETHIFRYAWEHDTLAAASAELFNDSAWGKGGAMAFPKRFASDLTRPLRRAFGLAQGTASLDTEDVPNTRHDLGWFRQRALQARLEEEADPVAFCRRFFGELAERHGRHRMTIEKTPTNVFQVSRIREAFPQAKLVSIHRDGRDVVISDAHHLRRAYNREQRFADSVSGWVRAMEAELDAVESCDIHQLSYEDLHADPEARVRELLDFLGLSSDADDVRRMIDMSSFEAMSGGRKPGEEQASSFHRKGVVGDWRGKLDERELGEFAAIGGPMLVRLGYEESPKLEDWNL